MLGWPATGVAAGAPAPRPSEHRLATATAADEPREHVATQPPRTPSAVGQRLAHTLEVASRDDHRQYAVLDGDATEDAHPGQVITGERSSELAGAPPPTG